MMGILLYCACEAEAVAESLVLPDVLVLSHPRDVDRAAAFLAHGGTVLALPSMSTGWRAPPGTIIAFTARYVRRMLDAPMGHVIAGFEQSCARTAPTPED